MLERALPPRDPAQRLLLQLPRRQRGRPWLLERRLLAATAVVDDHGRLAIRGGGRRAAGLLGGGQGAVEE